MGSRLRRQARRRERPIRGQVRNIVHRSRLEHPGVEEIVHRNVEHIDPNDPLAALVDMLMPRPARRQDHVAALHRTRLAVDHRDRAAAIEHEAQRAHGVAVRPRPFARHQDLKVDRQCLAGAQPAARIQRRVVQHQDPAFGIVHRGRAHRGFDKGLHRLPTPDMGNFDRRVGPAGAFPQGGNAGRPHGGVKLVLGCRGRRRGIAAVPDFRHAQPPVAAIRFGNSSTNRPTPVTVARSPFDQKPTRASPADRLLGRGVGVARQMVQRPGGQARRAPGGGAEEIPAAIVAQPPKPRTSIPILFHR